VRRLTPPALLAPDIQRAIIDGAPACGADIAAVDQHRNPVAWDGQRRMFGFATAAQDPS
jgi:hypothetical protein